LSELNIITEIIPVSKFQVLEQATGISLKITSFSKKGRVFIAIYEED
jgi:hypothetical protein